MSFRQVNVLCKQWDWDGSFPNCFLGIFRTCLLDMILSQTKAFLLNARKTEVINFDIWRCNAVLSFRIVPVWGRSRARKGGICEFLINFFLLFFSPSCYQESRFLPIFYTITFFQINFHYNCIIIHLNLFSYWKVDLKYSYIINNQPFFLHALTLILILFFFPPFYWLNKNNSLHSGNEIEIKNTIYFKSI